MVLILCMFSLEWFRESFFLRVICWLSFEVG